MSQNKRPAEHQDGECPHLEQCQADGNKPYDLSRELRERIARIRRLIACQLPGDPLRPEMLYSAEDLLHAEQTARCLTCLSIDLSESHNQIRALLDGSTPSSPEEDFQEERNFNC